MHEPKAFPSKQVTLPELDPARGAGVVTDTSAVNVLRSLNSSHNLVVDGECEGLGLPVKLRVWN